MGEEVRCPVWADVVEREPSEPTTWADEIDRLRSDGPPAYAGDVPGAVLCRACGCSLLSDFAWECVGGGLIERRDFVDACLAWGWKPMWNTHRPECSRCGGDA